MEVIQEIASLPQQSHEGSCVYFACEEGGGVGSLVSCHNSFKTVGQ
jgi:hypothetical protein